MQRNQVQRPVGVQAPFVVIMDHRTEELRGVLRAENLRGMVFEPRNWNSAMLGGEIDVDRVDVVIVWKREVDEGLQEVLRKLNSSRIHATRKIWIVPTEHRGLEGYDRIIRQREPDNMRSLIIQANVMMIPIKNEEEKARLKRLARQRRAEEWRRERRFGGELWEDPLEVTAHKEEVYLTGFRMEENDQGKGVRRLRT
uniref:Uncharacterized protein n=1 Tax=Meloidogyne javanica TaxID=6303 RepID=A0A915LU88_MELJA